MDEYDDDVLIRTSLLDACPAPTFSTALLPAHVFVLSSIALRTLTDPTHARRIRHTETIRAFIGWLARLAWRKGGRDSLTPNKAKSKSLNDELALGRSTTQPAPSLSAVTRFNLENGTASSIPQTGTNTPHRPPLVTLASSSGAWTDSVASRAPSQLNLGQALANGVSGSIGGARNRAGAGGCRIVIWRREHGFMCRANTVAQYVECSRAAVKIATPYPAPTNTPQGVFISPDCFIHPSAYDNLGEKVGIKRSIVGQRCIIGKGSKLTNTILMDAVVLGEK